MIILYTCIYIITSDIKEKKENLIIINLIYRRVFIIIKIYNIDIEEKK